VDVYGNKVQAKALPGDGLGTKHETVKMSRGKEEAGNRSGL